jgi:hypothetical protein
VVAPPVAPPPSSRGYRLLDEATNLRGGWGGPDPFLEPEKAIAFNEQIIALYKQAAEAFAAEGNKYGQGIAEGWIPRMEEANKNIRERFIEREDLKNNGEDWFVAVSFKEDVDLENRIEQFAQRNGGERVNANTSFLGRRRELHFRFPSGLAMSNFYRDLGRLPPKIRTEMYPPPHAPVPNPLEDNLAVTDEIQPGVGGQPRVAEAEICDNLTCEIAHFLVRGDHVEFVSVEQVRAVGSHALDPYKMPSDIVLPAKYVLVHDATGIILTPCDLYAVKWHRSGAKRALEIAPEDLTAAHDYFGDDAALRSGSIDIPDGPWKRLARVKFIRYRRYGFSNHFEHEYAPAVDLLYSKRPLAWKLALPEGCVVDARGFVVP